MKASCRWSRSTCRWLGVVLAVALAAAGLQATGATAALAAVAAKGPSSGPVSNAFAMGGGVDGSIDQRTGAFQASVPLVNVAGRAGPGLSLTLSYDQSLAMLGTAGDRFGFGAGWTLGIPWVNTAGGVTVYPASGGAYTYDASTPTGLADYPLRDLTFSRDPGKLPARPGLAKAQNYQYTLTNLGGTVDRFDAQGNLVEQVDRFGNAIDITWRQSGHSWQPASIVDSYGQVTTFSYSTGQVTVTSPVNAENITAATTLHIDNTGLLTSVTDPLNQVTRFQYTAYPSLNAQLLSSVTSPAGEQTTVTYTQPLVRDEPSLIVASAVKVTDAARNPVQPELQFSIYDPSGDEHNYTGYPLYNNSPNGLFNSGDKGYQYTTELANGTSTVFATYNSLHLLVTQRVVVANPPQGTVVSQIQAYTYPPVASVANLPANYSKPTSVTVNYGDPKFGDTRKVTTSSDYNDKGELVTATNAVGMVTKDSYFPNGLLDTQTVTGPDGETSVTTDTLTADGKSVHTVTTAVGATAATATARTVATYDYNSFGQVTGESQAWAPGAKPPGDTGGPDHIDDTQQISVDTAAHTQTDTVTAAAGTPQAATTSTVTDLVTGEVLSQTNPDDLTTSYTYDALGRQLTQTAPGGQVTKTAYTSPTVTTVTAPSGLATQTTTDVLGRTVKVTDNVSDQKLVADPAARTLQTDSYSPDGTQLATTTPAGTTTTGFDPLGRPTQIVDPGGITQADTYNDAKNTQAISLLPAHATDPTSVTTDTFSNLNAPTGSSTSYPDGTQQAPTAETYDGLGRVASFTASNVTTTVGYPGTGGLQSETTLTPDATGTFPGQPVMASTGNTMSGAMTTKTLNEQAPTKRSAPARAKSTPGSATGSTYTYNAAGQVATATDPAGHSTRYTYTPGGQILTITTPSGAVTSYTYDKDTGRLKEKDIQAPDGSTQATAYTYYPDTGLVKSVYDPAHPDDAMTYDYDADGHVIAIHYPDGTSTAASYGDNGKLATTTDITGAVTSYTYNADGNCGPTVTDLCNAVQKRDGTTLASIAYTYDSLDRVHTITRGNGVTTTLDYTDANQVRTETTTAADGSVLRRDDYTYDSHGNIYTHTITSAPPAPATARPASRLAAAAGTPVTTTTEYGYDAYNRLISSTVYPGGTATGTPTTATSYTVNVAGDVTGQKTTTADGKTTTTVNTIDGGRLTARDVDGVMSHQDFSTDGSVTKDLAGNSYTHDLAGQIASVTTPAGATTSYSYWPDGTRRAATTTTGGVDHTTTYHYATAGQLANDTYTGGGPAVTASYLMGVNREARTLATTGAGRTTQVSGPGTGYYISDAHSSVVALTGDHGQLTAAYAYSDYGEPTGPETGLLPSPAPDPAGNAAVNPFTYDGAYTNPGTGTQYLPARTYDPAQGRFLSLDAADQLNRYQAFSTNPILNTDPTGQEALPQYVVDGLAAVLFLFIGAVSLGTGLPVLAGALGITAAAADAAEATGAAIATAILETASGLANVGAGATSATLAVNDVQSLTGEGFLSEDAKKSLETANFALGSAGSLAEFGAAWTDIPAQAEEAAAAATSQNAAYVEGANAGLQAGQKVGYNAGAEVGTANGYKAGFDVGRAQGQAAGFAEGQAAGYQSGFSSGYWQGLDEGAAASGQLPGIAQNSTGSVQELVAAEPLDRVQPMAAPQLELTDATGQDQQLNSAALSFQGASEVPGSPSTTSLPTADATSQGTGGTTGSALTGEATTGTEEVLQNNTPTQPPVPAANPTGGNNAFSAMSQVSSGFSDESGLTQNTLGPPSGL